MIFDILIVLVILYKLKKEKNSTKIKNPNFQYFTLVAKDK